MKCLADQIDRNIGLINSSTGFLKYLLILLSIATIILYHLKVGWLINVRFQNEPEPYEKLTI